jgi:DNA-binding NarL/FixJ family response regulator
MEVLGFLGHGLSRRDIAARMAISAGTLKTYAGRLADKLCLPDAGGLRAFARNCGCKG